MSDDVNDFLDGLISQDSAEDQAAQMAEARDYRNRVADGFVEAMAQTIEKPYADVDGEKYIHVDVLRAVGGVFVTRGVQTQLMTMFGNNPKADGAVAVYSEAATYLDVLVCLATGQPVNPVE